MHQCWSVFISKMSATVETSIIKFFTPYGGSVGGFNTTSRVPYIAIPPSFDNTRKNLTGRNEIPKKSKIIAPYFTSMLNEHCSVLPHFREVYICHLNNVIQLLVWKQYITWCRILRFSKRSSNLYLSFSKEIQNERVSIVQMQLFWNTSGGKTFPLFLVMAKNDTHKQK